MNNNPNNGMPRRPQSGRTPANAARSSEISVLSAILTGRRSRSIACVIIALVVTFTAVVTVAASIVASHLADTEGGERQVLSADTDKAKDTDNSGAQSTEKSTEASTDTDKKDTEASTDTDKTTDTDKADDKKSPDTDADKSGADTETKDTEKTKAAGVHTITVTFYDKENLVSDTTAKTLGDFLLYSGITLTDAQLENLDLSTKLDSDMTFNADRVSYDTITEDEVVPYDTQYVDSTQIAVGTESVSQNGVNGVLTRSFDVKYVNGVEVYREQKAAWYSTEPVDQIILRGVEGQTTVTTPSSGSGTRAAANGLPAATVYEEGYVTGADGVSRHYYAYIDVQATVYNAGGITASGLPADENAMGVGRYDGTLTPIIPFGTRCYVISARGDCGERISADYGNMFGNKIDLCMYPSNPLYYGFGWQSARVYILG